MLVIGCLVGAVNLPLQGTLNGGRGLSTILVPNTAAILNTAFFNNFVHSHQNTAKMTDTARWKATVYVGGLAPMVTVATIHDAFLPFGDIADVSLPKNENPNSNTTEPHRGFAYVEFEDADDAKEAMDNMDQSELFGRVIKVTAAKAPKSADEGLGSKKALWEQVSLVAHVTILTSWY